MVIASRYLEGQKSEDDDLASRMANGFFTRAINWLYGAHYTDALTMFKVFRRDLLWNLRLVECRQEHFEVLLACRIAKNRGLRYSEVSCQEPPRLDDGGSRAHPGPFGKYRSAFAFLWIILRERFNGRKWKGT